ncbi:unnamed protein product, partial [marine sediment metagenome]
IILILTASVLSSVHALDYDYHTERSFIQWEPPANTKVWNATENSDADIANNWIPAVIPQSGEDVIFNATSTFNCNWDLVEMVGNFSILSGYSGIITQSVSFSVNNFLMLTATFHGDSNSILTCLNSFEQTGGNALSTDLKLKMTGTGNLATTYNLDTIGRFHSLEIDTAGIITITDDVSPRFHFTLTAGTVNISSGKYLDARFYADATFTFTDGIIEGSGTFRIICLTLTPVSIPFGNYNSSTE